ASLGGRASEDSTGTKIRLMSETLRARDQGDLAAAQRALEQLARLAPSDRTIEKLRAEIEAQAIAQRAVLAKEAEAQRAAEAAARLAAENAEAVRRESEAAAHREAEAAAGIVAQATGAVPVERKPDASAAPAHPEAPAAIAWLE